ncbi:MAG: 2-dehydro-3-deoxygalactonokinase [Bosea sp. (in: a-proteobacteria)]|uniref:2-dehydro-3-deoxygalactonokinase n=1 Tax=Bosea sp. (in: a-proteobacteria) TaxID=1871050 RepID=UPI002734944C|nr:2-dehydro-3-deoxygalactonokinase [Bosea sp. (in: a-proteobacteria)]MDP3601862.1 2-dehydro-3-deoxygalactonokinase [Bosea sp. (in: a-proteobacteria)]
MPRPLIALDWGTTRARAFLLSERGEVRERRSADQGIQSVPAGGFPAAFEAIAGDLRRMAPEAQIVLAGMVGSRNGWVEAAYVPCPASPDAIAAAGLKVALADGTPALILPGLSCDEGAFDVMRGEETLIVGLGLEDGIVCLPGTHSKWALVEGGRITRFASFMTGEIWGLLRQNSILSRLAEEQSEEGARLGLAAGFAASRRPGGLLNTAFAARSEVLAGRLPGAAVGPYLSALLVGHEIAGALALFGRHDTVHLVAEGAMAESYGAGLAAAGLQALVTTPEAAFVGGIRRLAGAIAA